jgi:hypothetical protein
MPRPRKNSAPSILGLFAWAEALGEALGRSVARGMNQAFAGTGLSSLASANTAPRKRGRPAKPVVGYVPPSQRCRVAGCGRPARSKGLCSAHYQAARRKKLGRA